MGPAVVLGQDLSEGAGPEATVRWQIWQRVTGSWVTVTGKRREGDLLICLYDASSPGVILPRGHGMHGAVCRPGRGDVGVGGGLLEQHGKLAALLGGEAGAEVPPDRLPVHRPG